MRRILFAVVTVAALSGCGQTGPLYLPDEPQTNQAETEVNDQQLPQS